MTEFGLERRLGECPAAEREEVRLPADCVHRDVERRASEAPEALAVVGGGRSLRYRDLNGQANRLAHLLRGRGVGPEIVVGLLFPRIPDSIVAALAVLKSGGCYLPLDPAYPDERLLFALADAGAFALLVPRELIAVRPGLAKTGTPLLVVEDLGEELARFPESDPSPSATLGNLAYVIYTSGSSGLPKGVEIEHRGLANLVAWHRSTYSVRPSDRASRLAGSAFDAAVWEIWPYLASGASLHLPADELVPAPDRLAAWLLAEQVTLSFLPTPLAEAVLREPFPATGPLRAILTGGDRLHLRPRPELPFALVNHYGPTECSVVATAGVVSPDQNSALPGIGLPIAGIVGFRVTAEGDLAAPEDEGELLLGGLGLARGYRGRADLTAERFVPDSFSGSPGTRLYRTGDLVRPGAGSEGLDFVGRVDFQVKIRGFRIELGEIEAALRLQPAVREAAVLAVALGERERRLVGYVVPRDEATPWGDLTSAFAAWLAERLPEYMVPALWVRLTRLPLTPNGKIDRALLPAPEIGSAEFRASVGPTELLVAGLFSEVLGLERVGADEDFFALGGHSLRATQVASRLRAALGWEIPARALFDRPTVAALAAWLDLEKGEGDQLAAEAEWRIAPIPRDPGLRCELPASFAQQGLLLADRWGKRSSIFNTPFAFDLCGPLAVPALGYAVESVVDRHESLRTHFAEHDGDHFQVIEPKLEIPLPSIDLSALPQAMLGEEADRLATEEAVRAFDLMRGPVARFRLLRLAPQRHSLLVLLHHIVSDDWSVSLLAEDLGRHYSWAATGGGSLPAPLSVQYADFSHWQRVWLRGSALERQLDWWRGHLLPPLPILELPADRPRPARQSFRGARLRRPISSPALDALRRLAARVEASPFMVLFAAWNALLARYAGTEELVSGTPIANRHRLEVEGLIGCFVNTLVVRGDLRGDPDLSELTSRVRESLLGAYSHQDLPFERLVEELAGERDLSRSALIDAFLIYANAPRPPAELAPGVALTLRELEVGGAKVDLSLFLEEGSSGGLSGVWEYSTDLFDRASVERMASHFDSLLARGGATGAPPLSVLPLLSAQELAELVHLANGPSPTPHPATLLHQLFFDQAARTPEAVALIVGAQRFTYGALAGRTLDLARSLRGLGVGPETGVAIYLERGPYLVPALLAVMAAGGFYVPLDLRHPADRIAFLLDDSGCRVVLSQSGLAERLPTAAGLEVLRLDVAAEVESAAEAAPRAPAGDVDPANLAYLIYTSGSTGRPKAVAIAQRSAVALAHWGRDAFSSLDLSGVLAATSITFDLSVFEIFVPLAWGGTVILAEDALSLPRLPAAREVRLINTVPSALAELLRMEALPATVRTVNLAGEALPRALADEIHALPNVLGLYNLYGPSEDTTYSTYALVERGTARAPRIGRPLPGSSAWIVDPYGNPQPMGVPGELWLGGAGLARGYLHRPDLTAARFIPDPRAETPGARVYRTGDLVRMGPGGDLDYLGRIDHQVKVRGFRIELGEIEQALAAREEVAAAVVLALQHAVRGLELVAFIVPRPPATTLNTIALREGLGRHLPEYMLPVRYQRLATLPLTPNGKVDRRALAEVVAAEGGEENAADAPIGPVEERVAAIFMGVLGIDAVGAEESFFERGGNSLVATRVLARVRKAFGVELELRTLFESPTVRSLSRRLVAELEREGEPAAQPLVAVKRPLGAVPLTFAQERFWFLEHLERGASLYSMPFVLALAGPLAVPALWAALEALSRRHEILRTTYAETTELPLQRVAAPSRQAQAIVDLSALPPGARELEAQDLALREAQRPFALEREFPLRTTMLRLATTEHRLLLTQHHIASDGRSVDIVVRDLQAFYGAALEHRAPRLPKLPIQYADFALWQRRRWSDEALLSAAERARARLSGAPLLLELPADRSASSRKRSQGSVHRTVLSPQASTWVEGLAQAAAGTPFMVFLAVLQLLLGRLGGVGDLLVGSPSGGRLHGETEDLIGLFLNTLVLRARLAADETFSQLLAAAREDTLTAFADQEVPFEKLVEALAPDRQLARNPIFQVLFVFQGRRGKEIELGPGLELNLGETLSGQAKFDLKLVIERENSGYCASWEYSEDVYDRASIERWSQIYLRLAETFSARPNLRLAAVSLMDDAEKAAILAGWTASSLPAPLLLQRFAEWVERTPDAIAAEDDGEILTYRELDTLASRVAGSLAPFVGPERDGEAVVALCLPRSARMVGAILGVMKAGGVYLALDSEVPEERLAHFLRDSQACVLLGDASTLVRLGSAAPAVLDLAALPDGVHGFEPRGFGADRARGAYLIYTSGSTGSPKGVLVEQRQLASYVAAVLARMDLAAPARFATVSTFAADLGHTALFPALASGGTVVVVATERLLDPEALAASFLARPVDVLKVVPSHLAALMTVDRPERLLPRRLLVLGGEAASGSLLQRVGSIEPSCRLLNHYGPTETTVGVLAHPTWEGGKAEGEAASTLPLGRPMVNSRAVVLDHWLELAAPGVRGELWIGGPQVARGYLGRPDLTAERFVPDPFGGSGERLYRTGDRVRRRVDGTFEFLGRIDQQVKIRGFRVEPGEVEAALRSLDGVADALVLARREGGGEPTLVAYLVPAVSGRQTLPTPEELGAILRRSLPDAMVPSFFVVLAALPRTANGKVDRAALPPPRPAVLESADAARPLSPTEGAVAEIFARILERDDIGARSDFFQLGGHSLAATRAVIRLRRTLGIDLELRAFFDHPTVEGLAAFLEASGLGGAFDPDETGPAGVRPLLVPVSQTQQRIWLLEQLSPESGLFNMPSRFRVQGTLSIPRLEAALAALFARHEALRTCFALEDELPVMVLDQPTEVPFLTVDLGGLPLAAGEVAFGEAARTLAVTPFSLDRGPLVRAVAVLGAPGRSELLLTLHHLISDGWSNGILVSDLAALYRASASGRIFPLPPLTKQFADFALWQRRWLQGEVLERQLQFWRHELAGTIEPLDLPTDRPRRPAAGFSGRFEHLDLDLVLLRSVEELGRRSQGTLFVTLLAAFELLLARQSGREDFALGAPVANRDRFDAEGIVGCFVNTLVLRSDVAGVRSFAELLGRVRERVVGALGHQDVPFERLVEEFVPNRDLSRSPLFQAVFTVGGEGRRRLELSPDTELHLVPSHSRTAKMELLLNVSSDGGSAAIDIEYRSDLWDPVSIRSLAARFSALVRSAVAAPDAPLSALSALLPGERQQLLVEWSGEMDGVAAAAQSPAGAFVAQALRRPDSVAARMGGVEVTYSELDRRSNWLARLLLQQAQPGAAVAVYLEPSLERCAAILGVLKAGLPILALDPALPASTREATFRLVPHALALIHSSQSRLFDRVAWPGVELLEIDRLGSAADGPLPLPGVEAVAVLRVEMVETEDGAVPVLVELGASDLYHRSTAPLAPLGVDDRDVHLSWHGAGGELAHLEILGAMAIGGCLEIAASSAANDAAQLRAALDLRVTVLQGSPGRWRSLLASGWKGGAGFKAVVRGESLRGDLARELSGLVGDLWHGDLGVLGEVLGTDRSNPAARQEAGSLPLGRPLAGSVVRILAPDGGLGPVCGAGELCVGGAGSVRAVSDSISGAQFSVDPWGGLAQGGKPPLLYRTGVRARWTRDGRVCLLGRRAPCVKIRGHRVELGEIEEALGRLAGVAEAAVVTRVAVGGDVDLVGFLLLNPQAPSLEELKLACRAELPPNWVPASLSSLPAFPLTVDGGADLSALAALGAEQRQAAASHLAPRSELEIGVATIWSEVLGRERIGLRDSFWELGGHSLLATKVLARLARTFGVELPFDSLFRSPQLQDFTVLVEQRLMGGDLEEEEEDLPLVAR